MSASGCWNRDVKDCAQVWTWCLLRNAPSLRWEGQTHTRAEHFLLLLRISLYPFCLWGLKSSYSEGCYRQGYHLWGCNDGLSECTMGVSLWHTKAGFLKCAPPPVCLLISSSIHIQLFHLVPGFIWTAVNAVSNQSVQIYGTALVLEGRASVLYVTALTVTPYLREAAGTADHQR